MAARNSQGIGALTKAYAEKYEVSQTESSKIVKNVFALIFDSLNKVGDQVDITDTAHIKVVERAGRNGFNPVTKEPMYINPSVGLKISAGKALKAKLNGK